MVDDTSLCDAPEEIIIFKEELYPKPKLSTFCTLYQHYQHCHEKNKNLLKLIVEKLKKIK